MSRSETHPTRINYPDMILLTGAGSLTIQKLNLGRLLKFYATLAINSTPPSGIRPLFH